MLIPATAAAMVAHPHASTEREGEGDERVE
jgi:hypothetical protein